MRVLCSAALAVVLVVPGCSMFDSGDGGAVPTPPNTVSTGEGGVTLRNTAYNPQRVSTVVGREVVWTFDDNGLTHTVTADDGSFDSGRLSSGEFRRTFDQPGEIAYHCEVHARMKGTVVVS